jgi:hypothetical protein
MNHCSTLRSLVRMGLIVFLVSACGTSLSTPTSAPSSTSTPIATATPAPPTATPEHVLKLVEEGNGITLDDGWPLGATVHTADGDIPRGMLSPDYKSTLVDVSELAGKEDSLGLVHQQNSDGETSHAVSIDIRQLESFYIDKDYIVFPFGTNAVESGGPFVRLVIRAISYDNGKLMDQQEITVQQGERTVSGKLSNGVFDLSGVTSDPIEITVTGLSATTTYQYKAFITLRGAVKGFITYEIGMPIR